MVHRQRWSVVRVVVVGAGEVGTHVAQLLSREGHDVTVIESDAARIAQLDKILDVTIIKGSATDPELMRAAGIANGPANYTTPWAQTW
jgi:trk system potassium uptake protein TrkA